MKQVFVAVALAVGLSMVGSASADQFSDAIKYRKAAFTMVKWNFGPMGAMVKGDIPFDKEAFAVRAERVAMLAKTPWDGFIEGSDIGKTEAKAEVWLKAAEFQKKAKEFQEQADKLAAAAKGSDMGAIKAQFAATAKSCKSCHESFKED